MINFDAMFPCVSNESNFLGNEHGHGRSNGVVGYGFSNGNKREFIFGGKISGRSSRRERELLRRYGATYFYGNGIFSKELHGSDGGEQGERLVSSLYY
jgi:hypothetical protein